MIGQLGRRPTKRDARNVRLATILATAPPLPAAPLARNWGRRYLLSGDPGEELPFQTFNNLTYGDCTCATLGHYDEAVCAATGAEQTITTDVVLDAYDAISDWDRERPNENDVGAYNLDAVKWFRKQGLITAFASVYPTNRASIELCINLFHGLNVGADLPLAAQTQKIWDVAPPGERSPDYDRRSWGGHSMLAVGYDQASVWFITWGRLQQATWSWFFTYVDECYAMIHHTLVKDQSNVTPAGYIAEQILSTLNKV